MTTPWFMRINKWWLLLLSLLFFILGILLVFIGVKNNQNGYTYASIICFLFFTLSTQAFMSRVVTYKPKMKKLPHNNYEYQSSLDLVSHLQENNFIFKKNKFGTVAIKIIGSVCYKVTIIDDLDIYLSDDKSKIEDKPTKGIEKCDKLIGFEFFTKDEKDIFNKSINLSFKGEKVYYEAFNMDEVKNIIVEPNAIDPEEHKENYLKLIEMLKLVKKVEENK
ncbi:MAG: hypothetical protein K6G28_06055 [Acholeplasmatales bacterium]|nr:hypothetical protein [Acholeplasmatales bacterium]